MKTRLELLVSYAYHLRYFEQSILLLVGIYTPAKGMEHNAILNPNGRYLSARSKFGAYPRCGANDAGIINALG